MTFSLGKKKPWDWVKNFQIACFLPFAFSTCIQIGQSHEILCLEKSWFSEICSHLPSGFPCSEQGLSSLFKRFTSFAVPKEDKRNQHRAPGRRRCLLRSEMRSCANFCTLVCRVTESWELTTLLLSMPYSKRLLFASTLGNRKGNFLCTIVISLI